MDVKIKHVALDYYPEFKCLCDKCNYTCCYQWQIDINRPDYMKIKNLRTSKEMKQIIDNGIKRVKNDSTRLYAKMIMREDGNCPFLGKDRLCNLQKECGYNVLPEVCKKFPRIENIAPVQWEKLCSTGCEQVVNLLLARPQGLRMIEIESEKGKVPYMDQEYAAKKFAARPGLEFYKEIQMLFMGILQNRNYSLSQRMVLLGLVSRDLDKVQTKQDAISFLQKSISLLEYSPQMQQQLCELQTNTTEGVLIAFKQMITQDIKLQNQIRDQYFDAMMDSVHQNLGIELKKQENTAATVELLVDIQKYAVAKIHFDNIPETQYLMENVMVNLMIYNQYPQKWMDDKTPVWDNYLDFVIQYNIFMVLCVGYMADKTDIQDLVHSVTVCSRTLQHNTNFRKQLVQQWKEEKLDTLAQIAYLVG